MSPGLRRIIDQFTGPAMIQNARLDVLAVNRQAELLYPQHEGVTFNYARHIFLEEYPDSARPRNLADAQALTVSSLHAASARTPHDRLLMELIGVLSTRSETFRHLWANFNVDVCRGDDKLLAHPEVGDLDFHFDAFDLTDESGLVLVVYASEPHSRTAESMALLESWAGAPAAERSSPTGRR